MSVSLADLEGRPKQQITFSTSHLLLAFLLGELVKHDMQSFHQNDVAAAASDNAHR